MIQTFASSETESFFETGKSRSFPPEILKWAAMLLTQLNAATVVEDLHIPPSNHLEILSGNRDGQWSIRINQQWRVCFYFKDGDAFNVEIVDYHQGVCIMIKNVLPAIHPGEFLAEIIEEYGLSQAKFARAIGVSPMRISHIIKGTRPVTAELAIFFGRAFGQSARYWLNLQADYDLKTAENIIGSRINSVHVLAHA